MIKREEKINGYKQELNIKYVGFMLFSLLIKQSRVFLIKKVAVESDLYWIVFLIVFIK
jgi:hypothetical protein